MNIKKAIITGTCLILFSAFTGNAEEKKLEHFDKRNFSRPTVIDNKWLPMKPGMEYVYMGHTQKGKQRISHRVIRTVTDLTKEVNGIDAVVLWERDYADGKLAETELAFFAQDNEGNVWHLGQYSETYENSDFGGSQAWIAGAENAQAGIFMKAKPRIGMSYSQGYSPPPITWTDRAKVEKFEPKVCVPAGCYENVLRIAEYSEEEGPHAQQLKYYAAGIGNVRIDWRGKDEKTRETLELASVFKLRPAALKSVRSEALKLEGRASVYSTTKPAKVRKD